MKFDDSLTQQLSQIADEPGPASAVDLDRAIAKARRTATTRRAAGATAGIAVVAVAATLCVTALGGGSAPVLAGGRPSASPSSPSTTVALTGIDPLITHFKFGTLPQGFVPASVNVQSGAPEEISAADPDTQQAADVTMSTSPGLPAPPHDKGGGVATQSPADPVGSDPAFWYWAPGSTQAAENGEVILNWEYASNLWATLDFTGSNTGTAITGTVYQLAQSVQFGQTTQYPLPLHIDQIFSMQETGASYDVAVMSGGYWSSNLVFGPPGASSQDQLQITVIGVPPGSDVNRSTGLPTDAVDSESASSSASTAGAGKASASAGVPSTLGGCAVTVSNDQQGTGLQAPDCHGLQITISAFGAAYNVIQQHGGIGAFFSSITWLGLDQANWTTHVIG